MSIEDIHRICKKYDIKNYTINEDLSVDVVGSVQLCMVGERNLKKLPLKFNKVTGDFWCQHNNLTSLEGAPNFVGVSFYCSWNKLTSLEGAPSYVGGGFHCIGNRLTTLKGIPVDMKYLVLPDHFTYSDYVVYCNSYKRDLKFKKLLKCQ